MSPTRSPWEGAIEEDQPMCCEWVDCTYVGSRYEHQIDRVYGYERHREISTGTYRVVTDDNGHQRAVEEWTDGPPPKDGPGAPKWPEY